MRRSTEHPGEPDRFSEAPSRCDYCGAPGRVDIELRQVEDRDFGPSLVCARCDPDPERKD